MSEWRDIETAPRETDGGSGPSILTWNGLSYDVAWHAWDDNGKPIFFNGNVVVEPTHWMPLPEAPK